MTKFDLIGAIRTYCTSKSYKFYAGENWDVDYNASKDSFVNGQIIVVAEFVARPSFGKGWGIAEIEYDGILLVGRKLDADGTMTPAPLYNSTPVSLDETFIQKYDRRLLTLHSTWATIVKDISCANELIPKNANMPMKLNQYDACIDFISGEITFVQ